MDKEFDKRLGMGIVTARSRGIPDQAILSQLSEHPDLKDGIQSALSDGMDATSLVDYLGGKYAEEAKRIHSTATDGMSRTDKVLAGMGARFVDYGVSAGQMVGIFNASDADKKAEIDKALMETPEGFVGSILTDVAVAAALPASASGTAARVTAGAVGGGLFGALDPVKTGESRGKNMTTGAAFGAAIPLGGKIISRLRNARAGKLGKKVSEVDADVLELADELDIPLSASQAGSGVGKVLNAAEKYIPFSGRAKRAAKAEKALVEGVNEFAEDYVDDIAGGVGRDLEEMIVESVRRSRQAVKTEAGKLFDNVSEITAKTPTTAVKLTNLREAAKALLKEGSPFAERMGQGPLIRRLQGIVDGTEAVTSDILDSSGKRLGKTASMSFDELRAFRSELGALKKQAERAMLSGSVGEKEVGLYKKLMMSLEADQKTWAKSNKHVSEAWAKARKFYKEKYVDVFQSNSSIRKMMDEANFNSDKVAQRFLGTENRFLSTKLFNALDEDGRKAARYLMLSRAISQVEKGDMKKAVRLLDFGKSGKVFFGEDELRSIGAMREIIKRMDDNMDPENLNRVTQLFFGGLGLSTWLHGVVGGAAAGIGGLAGANVAGMLNRSSAVRKVLTADSTIRGAGQAAQYLTQPAALAGALRADEIEERMQ